MAPLVMDEAVWLTIATAAGSAVTETAVAPAVAAATAISGRCRPLGWSPIVPPRAEGAVVVDGPTGAIPRDTADAQAQRRGRQRCGWQGRERHGRERQAPLPLPLPLP